MADNDDFRRLAAIVESTSDAVVSALVDGTITSWNPGAEAIFGYPAEEVLGRPAPYLLPPGEAASVAELLEPVLNGETVRNHETVRVRRDGTLVAVSFSASRLVNASGDVIGVSAIYRDMSDRARAEQERTEREAAELTTAKAVEASRLKSAFLSRMSHELRTPLNAILGFSQLLAMDDLATDQRSAVGQIHQAGRHLLELIDEVLDISRLESGAMRLSLESVHLGVVCDEAVAMIGPIAAPRSIQVALEPDTLNVHVHADQQRLKQVLLNLLSNGVKYNRPGGTVTVCGRTGPDGRARVTVRDTGIGIAADDMDRLFQPFERLSADELGIEGVGLGLVLSRDLMVAMNGTVGAVSRLGEGSEFWFEVPIAQEPSVGEARASVPALATSPAAHGSATVLYVEDNLANVRLVEHIAARRPNVTLLVAMQGRVALDLARAHRPDLVLLDLHLPDLPGEDVLAALKADPSTADTPVVIVSADATREGTRRTIALGAADYITKPFEIARILALFDEAGRVVRSPPARGLDHPAAALLPVPASGPLAGTWHEALDAVHDLRNHLSAIRNFCALLQDQNLGRASADVSAIHDAVVLAIDSVGRLDTITQRGVIGS